MAIITTHTFDGDGTQREFQVADTVLSESHARVWLETDGVWDEVSTTLWDLLGSTVLFDVAPPIGAGNVKIYVSNDGTFPAEYTSPSDAQIIANNIDAILSVAANIDNVIGMANSEYIVYDLPTGAAEGDLAVDTMTGNTYQWTNGEWILVAEGGTGGGGDTGSGLVIPIEPSLPALSTEGGFIYNTSDGQFYAYINGEWQYLTAPPPADTVYGIEVVSSLPTVDNFEGRTVFNTADSKLYQYVNGAYVQVVEATGVATTVADASITVAKFAAGLRPLEIVDVLPTVDLTVGRMVYLTTNGKIYRYLATGWTAEVATSDLSGTISETQIADNSITTAKIVANAVTANEILAGTITGDKIAANTITAGTIEAGAIGASQIAAGAITATKIFSSAVTADAIAANAITAGKIAADAITADKLAVNSVLAGNIASGAISTNHLGAGVVTANQIAADAITASKIDADALIGKRVQFDSTGATSTFITTDSMWGAQTCAFSFLNTNKTYGIVSRKSNSGAGSALYGHCSNALQTGAAVVGVQESSQSGSWGGVFYHKNYTAVAATSGAADGQWGLWTGQKTYSGGGYLPFTGSHLAYSPDNLKEGQIVYVEEARPTDIDNALVFVRKCNTAKDKRVFGIVSYAGNKMEKNIDNNEYIKGKYKKHLKNMKTKKMKEVEVNSVGEGAMLVSNENGNIENGDYITSGTNAMGMKQDEQMLMNFTVAKALEDVDWSKEKKNSKLIAVTYHCG